MRKLSFRKGLLPIDDLRFTGGRALSQERVLENFFPKEILVPMRQHIGRPSIPCVSEGMTVDIGQMIGRSASVFDTPVHAGISGTVTGIETVRLPDHTTCAAIRIVNDLKRRVHPMVALRNNTERLTPVELRKLLVLSGICGMGGEGVPAAAKCAQALKAKADTLLVNGLQSEPHLTCDLFLMHEQAKRVVNGAAVMAVACQTVHVIFCLQDTWKKEAAALLTVIPDVGKRYPSLTFEIRYFRPRFPQGYEKLLVKAMYGVDLPASDCVPERVKAVVFNVSTCAAFWDMVEKNMPCTSRIVTISDDYTSLRNVLVPVGTLLSELLERTPGLSACRRIVVGGALTGAAIPDLDYPVTKTTQGITLIKNEIRDKTPCIHCGSCVDACPVGLLPYVCVKLIDLKDQKAIEEEDIKRCISCGACSYVCPSNIDLSERIVRAAHTGKKKLPEALT